jgi:C4-dicarboxylate-specific signal transduction histidine kinase
MSGAPGALLQEDAGRDRATESSEQLRGRLRDLEHRVHLAEERRRALVHIMDDLNDSNRRLADQRKAMLHILSDYEQDRRRLAHQSERLDNSRRALLHILQDSHSSNSRLEAARKAMIHIMGDLQNTTEEIKRRERELRDKQEQLVQAAKLATLGELTTGIAHELNNPLNNIGLFVGNVLDQVAVGHIDAKHINHDLQKVVQQVNKATEIISHLRTFGRAAPVTVELVDVQEVIDRSLSLMHQQLRLRQIDVQVQRHQGRDAAVLGNPIQLEQVMINLLTNARDAVENAASKKIFLECTVHEPVVAIVVRDTGPGIPDGLEQRVFDPFFTTKEVGKGTGLGLSITYGIIKDHGGTISVQNVSDAGASFRIELPLAGHERPPRLVA